MSLLVLLALPVAVQAARVQGSGFAVEIPQGWETQADVMGVPLMARPPKATDPKGWGQDLLTVTVEAADRRRTCLEAFTQRKLGQFSYHAARFEKIEEEPLELDGRVATRLTLRYTEGPRELMAYVLILDTGSDFLTATLTAPPARFESQRALFRSTVESLRAASVRKIRK